LPGIITGSRLFYREELGPKYEGLSIEESTGALARTARRWAEGLADEKAEAPTLSDLTENRGHDAAVSALPAVAQVPHVSEDPPASRVFFSVLTYQVEQESR